MIVVSSQELTEMRPFVSPDAQILLQEVDFEKYFLVEVFQGWKPSGSYGAEVRRIMHRNDVITLYADFTEPVWGQVVTEGETSPYDVVKVRKPGPMGKEIEFVLQVDGRVVSSRRHFIP